MATETKEKKGKFDAKFWVTMVRAFLAVILGTALLFQPDKARPLLVNFMGGFWLAGGFVSLRWGASGERARNWSTIAGIIGIVAGIITILRHLLSGYVSMVAVAYLLGGVMILTGIMHAVNGFPDDKEGNRRSWASVLLGVFEVVLGTMLFISPLSYGPVVYWSITLWALLGSVILFREAWRHRKHVKENAQTAEETDAGNEAAAET